MNALRRSLFVAVLVYGGLYLVGCGSSGSSPDDAGSGGGSAGATGSGGAATGGATGNGGQA
ncbi:MAG TPA: hypothetical protein VHO06_15055, partial [Polyangia bacterium]|nr:hypothetical protein [Polyangia bacterium]